MGKIILLYTASFVFILAGLILVRTGFKKESFKSLMEKANYVPTKNYGKFYHIALGILCFILGLILMITKSK